MNTKEDQTPPAARPTPEDIARAKWNRSADIYNQWETLGSDEKRELIARESPPVVAMKSARPTPTRAPLSERIRPNSEAAAWVCEEVKSLERQLAEYERCVDLCHDAIGESRGSDITELHKYFEGYRNTINWVNELEDKLADERKSLESQRELIVLHRGEIDKLRDKLAKSDHEIDRLRAAVDESNIAELHRQLSAANAELDQIRNQLREEMHLHGITLDERDETRRERSEQARLLGMSGEREARLIAEREESRAERDALAEVLEQLMPFAPNSLCEDQYEIGVWKEASTALAAVKGGSHE